MKKIIDENYFDIVIDNALTDIYRNTTNDNITPINEFYSLVHLKKEELDACDIGTYVYHLFPTIFTLESDINMEQSGVTQVQNNPNFGFYGRGTLVGVVDTGIDYQHTAFRHQDGTSRILSIWDQTVPDGTMPQDFTFGSEYSRQMINLALQSPNPLSIVPSIDEIGHGTAIASIIAGNRNEETSIGGVAPEADIAVVKLKQAKKKNRSVYFIPADAVCYQGSDIQLGIRYLFQLSLSLKRPLALCVALGTSQGAHDGRGTTSYYLKYLEYIPKIGIATSAGNEGDKRRHYFGTIDTNNFYKEFELKVSNKDPLFSMEIWPYEPTRYAIQITTPTGERTQVVYPSIKECQQFNFIFETSIIWINNISFEEETGNQLILVRFQTPLEGIWKLRVTSIDNNSSSFHAWLPSGNLISEETFFPASSPDTTITSPGSTSNILTVGAYNPIDNTILPQSSRGYTRLNQVKPDLVAPGYELPCAAPNNLFGTATGTGAAAAFATGIIAMILEWAVVRGNYTNITQKEISILLIRGASRDSSLTYPNNIWGYGAINIQGFFDKLM